MAYSYLSSGPGSSDRSWIRLRLGDTSSGNVLLQDEEIDVLLDDYGSKYSAGAAAARAVGAGFSRQVTKQVGKLRITMAEASAHYFDLADKLDREAQIHSGGAYLGGASLSERQTEDDDTDWQGSVFGVGKNDNPGTSTLTDRVDD